MGLGSFSGKSEQSEITHQIITFKMTLNWAKHKDNFNLAASDINLSDLIRLVAHFEMTQSL